MFPVLVRTMTANSFSFRIFTVCKDEDLNFPMLKTDQTISIITSILSLAWCFSLYHATLKRGALDKDLAALFYRAVLFLSVLFQIIGRLFIMVLFAYSFGPGYYFPVLIFLGAHILLMTILHFIFSDAKMYWEKGGFLNLSFFHYMVGNGECDSVNEHLSRLVSLTTLSFSITTRSGQYLHSQLDQDGPAVDPVFQASATCVDPDATAGL